MGTIQTYTAMHDFFLSERDAATCAKLRGVEHRDIGLFAAGSYGLYPAERNQQVMRVWAVPRLFPEPQISGPCSPLPAAQMVRKLVRS